METYIPSTVVESVRKKNLFFTFISFVSILTFISFCFLFQAYTLTSYLDFCLMSIFHSCFQFKQSTSNQHSDLINSKNKSMSTLVFPEKYLLKKYLVKIMSWYVWGLHLQHFTSPLRLIIKILNFQDLSYFKWLGFWYGSTEFLCSDSVFIDADDFFPSLAFTCC